jgi:hypothetical protein
VIRRRRRGEQSAPVAHDEDRAAAAKRDAQAVRDVQRSLKLAKVREHGTGGGTLLTEPVLVFSGKDDREVRVLDRDSKEPGVARGFQDKRRKSRAIGFTKRVEHRLRSSGRPAGSAAAIYTISDEKGTEVATLVVNQA